MNTKTGQTVFGICGWKNSGKTTLIESLLPDLIEQGLSVAVVKHDAHGLDVDRRGKDSDRFFRAGGDVILKGPGEEICRFRADRDEELHQRIARLAPFHDLVIVEGHKTTPVPKVWLHGKDDRPRPAAVENVLAELPIGPEKGRSLSDRKRIVMPLLQQWLDRQWLEQPLIGCVLIGGRSRRMGVPKHLMETGGETWLERTVNLLGKVTGQVVAAGSGSLPEGLKELTVLPDVPGVSGPMAGLLAAQRWNPDASWLVAACDMPRLTVDALEWICSLRRPGVWAALPLLDPRTGSVEPLLALYDRRSRLLLERLASKGAFSLQEPVAHPKVITPQPAARLRGAWKNMNSIEDLEE